MHIWKPVSILKILEHPESSIRNFPLQNWRVIPRIVFLLCVLIGVQCQPEHSANAFVQPPADSNRKGHPPSTSDWLKDNGVESNLKSYRTYLKSLNQIDVNSDRIRELIEGLSSTDFRIREQSTDELKTIPTISLTDLRELEQDTDLSPEGRYRLAEVIRVRRQQKPAQIQFTMFCDIRDRKIPGLTDSIIQSFDHFEPENFVRHAAMQALMVTSQESDIAALKKVAQGSEYDNQLRAGALRCLTRLRPETAAELVLNSKIDLAKKPTGNLGLEIARVHVLNKRLEAFEVLFDLLKDDRSTIRESALASLVRLTDLKYSHHSTPVLDRADNVIEQTRSWLKDHESDVNYDWYHIPPKIGRRLVCQFDGNRIIELDEKGNVVWHFDAKQPFACLGTPDGRRFVMLYSTSCLLEFDGAGREIRRIVDLPANVSGICRRPNGNLVLAAGQDDDLILEIDATGKKVKSFVIKGKPTSAEIGVNGNLIVTLYGAKQVVEVDASGQIVNTISFKEAPYHATPLVSGNLLVTFPQNRKIIECDPSGKVIHRIDCKKYAYHAQKMDDGTFTFADESGLYRVDERGTEIVGQTYKGLGRVNYSYTY